MVVGGWLKNVSSLRNNCEGDVRNPGTPPPSWLPQTGQLPLAHVYAMMYYCLVKKFKGQATIG